MGGNPVDAGAGVCASAAGDVVTSSNPNRMWPDGAGKRRKTIMAARATRNAGYVNHLRVATRRCAALARRCERCVSRDRSRWAVGSFY